MTTARVLTVKALTEAVSRVVDRSFPNVLVEGEIAQINTPASGHAFIVLREGDARLPCVLWASTWRMLNPKPMVGQKVVCAGRLGLYPSQGTIQLYANSIRPAGDGDLARKLAAIRARLDAEGLLDPRRKRPLPKYPRVVGIATSATGAALQDFLRVASTRWPARLIVAPCTVQGEEAASSVIRALELLFDHGGSDIVVITRGGGAKLDLLPFHDETLARWIATAPIPVVSAVGHEIDTTIADLAADAIAPTPSAAAVLILPDAVELRRRVDEARGALIRGVSRQVQRRRQRVAELQQRLKHPQQRVVAGRQRALELQHRLHQAMTTRLSRTSGRLERAEGRLAALSPYGVLERGYAIVSRADGVVRDPGALNDGDRLAVRVARGSFSVRVDRDDAVAGVDSAAENS
jgi:exodeoxyribonuclease VII large subunit